LRIRTFLDLLFFKTGADLRVEVSRYYLNYFWWILEPVFTMAIFYFVFQVLLGQQTPNFVAFLLIGFTFWNWFGNSVNNAATSILNGRMLMLQVDINKVFFPLGIILQDLFKHLFVVTLLLVFLLFYPTPVSVTWIALPILMGIQGILVAAMAILAAMVVPFVPDLKLVIGTVLHLLMFASGVFFQIDDIVLPQHRSLMYLNPIAGLIKNYRLVLMYAQWPDWDYLLKVLLASVLLLLLGLCLLKRLDRLYPRICQE
jgi:lipopolysaccharide transport system permease protein